MTMKSFHWYVAPRSGRSSRSGECSGAAAGPRLPDEADVLEDEREPDRRDERHQSRLVAQRLVADALDRNVDDHAEEHREEQAHEDRVDLLRRRGARRRRSAERERKHERRRESGIWNEPVVDDSVVWKVPSMKLSPWAKLISSMIP
jgi:hypothetical protein